MAINISGWKEWNFYYYCNAIFKSLPNDDNEYIFFISKDFKKFFINNCEQNLLTTPADGLYKSLVENLKMVWAKKMR